MSRTYQNTLDHNYCSSWLSIDTPDGWCHYFDIEEYQEEVDHVIQELTRQCTILRAASE